MEYAMSNITNSSAVLANEANAALSIVNPIIVKIVIAILIFFIGFVIGKIVQRLILKFFQISDLDVIFKKRTGIKQPLSTIVAYIISYFIYIVAIVMALNRLDIATTLITTIVIILIVVLVLFVIFAGLILKIRGNIKQGDYIRIKDKRIEGYVASINSLNVRLETKKDEIVFVPNMVLFKSNIVKPKKVPK